MIYGYKQVRIHNPGYIEVLVWIRVRAEGQMVLGGTKSRAERLTVDAQRFCVSTDYMVLPGYDYVSPFVYRTEVAGAFASEYSHATYHHGKTTKAHRFVDYYDYGPAECLPGLHFYTARQMRARGNRTVVSHFDRLGDF